MADEMKKIKQVINDSGPGIAQDWHYLRQLGGIIPLDREESVSILDLGAGDGASLKRLNSFFPDGNIAWTGVDIGDSEEHLSRPKDAPEIVVYDGIDLPFDNESFDVVWSKQVLEHVRHPDKTISEVSRVLRPGGYFLGSVSQLEPYHSRSIFNWTYYGVYRVFEDHDLEVIQLKPGVDGFILMLRAIFGYDTGLNKLVGSETPIHSFISAIFEKTDSQDYHSTIAKYMAIAGHIHFMARAKPR